MATKELKEVLMHMRVKYSYQLFNAFPEYQYVLFFQLL